MNSLFCNKKQNFQEKGEAKQSLRQEIQFLEFVGGSITYPQLWVQYSLDDVNGN